MDYSAVLAQEAFTLEKAQKRALLNRRLRELVQYHYENCLEYGRILDFLDFSPEKELEYEDSPFIPIRLFKELALKSIPEEQIFKVMTSSGTTGQAVSKVYLDEETSRNQQKTLIKIMADFLPAERMPMLILDTARVVKERNFFSARRAGILGFSLFGRDKFYALDDDMQLNIAQIEEFLQKYHNQPIFAFGYTFIIWQYLYEELKRQGRRLDLSHVTVVHGGGWKKLAADAVTPTTFRAALREVCGDLDVADYYGMVEQTGCIHLECAEGHLHTSTYADVIVRRPLDFSPADFGERGIIEVVSLLPESYPGHALLTEDEGVLLGEDDCPCGRKGKYFKVLGRLKQAELRGCSDTYAAAF